MDDAARLKKGIVAGLVRDIPKAFWQDLRGGARVAYAEVFHTIENDPNVVPEQRIDRLRQDRHFRMESLLSTLAVRHGLKRSHTQLVENGQHYVYVTGGDIGLTQSYVPAIGDLPKPARYWERLASMNDIPRLDLGDEPAEVLVTKSIYGLIAHNPVGSRFEEDAQKLGMIQVCVPNRDAKSWALELALEELTAAYTADVKRPRKAPAPIWKEEKKKRDEAG